MNDTLMSQIVQILTEKFEIPAEDATPQTVFDDLGVDSLALLEMSLILEKRLGISIAEGVLESGQTIQQAAGALDVLGAAA
ncbi:acyl carrier protein [Streptomyces sp. NPDC006632]|uniref:acyl carrier protein n=1 Tax=Streptomyces sp. NPDC006632 TaxID=3157182 RepID=UPI0033B09395